MAGYLRIGQVAKQTGINPKTIRYYEQIGVLPRAARSQVIHGNGYRLYTPEDIQRLEGIKQAKMLDFTLAEVRELVLTAQKSCCTAMNPKLAYWVEGKLIEIDQRIAEMENLRKSLKRFKRQFKKTVMPPKARKENMPIIPLPCSDAACLNPKATQKTS